MRIKHAPDQPPWVRKLVGEHCLLIKNLRERDGVTSSPNIWRVLVCGTIVEVHRLDLESINEAS